jgi:hypothetical protein
MGLTELTRMVRWGRNREDGSLNGLTRVRKPIEATAFWAAVLLPVAYVPVLADGIGGLQGAGLFTSLVALHLIVLAVGHRYGRS